MFIRGMIHHQVHHQLDATLMHFSKQLLPVCQSPKLIHNILIVADVVTIIVIGRFVNWAKPEDINTQFLQIIELMNNAAQISNPIPVAVVKTARVYLIDNTLLPPDFIHLYLLSWFCSLSRLQVILKTIFRHCEE